MIAIQDKKLKNPINLVHLPITKYYLGHKYSYRLWQPNFAVVNNLRVNVVLV